MGDLEELQHKRVVVLSASALVFAAFAVWSLSSDLFVGGRFVGWESARVTIHLLSCTVLMTLTIVSIMMRSFVDNRRINHLKSHDPNTGLPNSFAWRQAVVSEIAANAGEKGVWLTLIDVARLRAINDSFGVEAGDVVIAELSDRLKTLRGTYTTVYRLAGDVFAIMTRGSTDSEEYQELTDRLFEMSRSPIHYNDKSIFLDVHAGSLHIDTPKVGFLEAMTNLETALARCKKSSGSWLVQYDEDLGRSQRHVSELQNDLRRDLEAGAIEPEFQPLIGPDGATVVGFEALARWHHPEYGDIPPASFIPIAEDLNMVSRLGEIMLVKACRQLRPFGNMIASVNISPEHFLWPDFASQVEAILSETGMPADRLAIEITENVLISDAKKAIEAMKTLRKMGVSIALDDFGTGYCGLSYLNQFDVDRIKIDQSFVKEIENSTSSRSMISTIVGLAGELGFNVIVEGVENENQMNYLSQFNGLWYQGYYFAKPLRLPELLASNMLSATDVSDFTGELGSADQTQDHASGADRIHRVLHSVREQITAAKSSIEPVSGN